VPSELVSRNALFVGGGDAYGFGGGVGTGMPLVSGYDPGGAFAVASSGSGCPHEKHTEAWPGVASVSDPHDGHLTWVVAAALPPGSDGAPNEGLARTPEAVPLHKEVSLHKEAVGRSLRREADRNRRHHHHRRTAGSDHPR